MNDASKSARIAPSLGYRFWAKGLLLAVFVLDTNPGALERIHIIGLQLGLVVYFVVWLASAAAIAFVAFRGGLALRLFWSIVWVASSIFGLSFWLITRRHMQLADAETLLNAIGFADNLSGTFDRQIIWSALAGFVGLIAVNLPNALGVTRIKWRRTLPAIMPLAPILMIMAVLYLRGGEGTNGMPVQFDVPAFLATIAGVHATIGSSPQRSEVAASPTVGKVAKNIIVIMDESVRGDLLDINSGPAYSGLLNRDDIAVNFGVMSSIANCSDTTNASFRYGVSRKDYQSDLVTNPAMWSYAIKAGFKTYYLDGQRHDGQLQNLMSEQERKLVDDFIQVDVAVAPSRKDIELAMRLRSILASDASDKFVYMNKMGSHFPYEGKYPLTATRFSPTTAQHYFGTDAGPGGITRPDDESPAARNRFRNSYLNSLSWNIGEFFDIFLKDLDLRNVVIFYMADHGQDLHEDGRPGYGTHCSNGWSAPTEGRVPFVVITGNPDLLRAFRDDATLNFNKVSQFNVFPSVLKAMGYDLRIVAQTTAVEPDIGTQLDPNEQMFLSTFFVRFGRRPVWNTIR